MAVNITRDMVTDKDCTECENDTATYVNKDFPEILLCGDDYSVLADRDKKDYTKISELPFPERDMDKEIFGDVVEDSDEDE